MTLTLRAVSLNDMPLSQPITARFGEHGGTIGRTDNNTMALPDPERHISRQQAEIRADRTGYLIRNVGSANPILVRNQMLAFGETAPLIDSDRLRIGGYLLEVVDDAGADATVVLAPALPDPPAADANGPATLGAPLSSSNPFADLFGAPPAATPSMAAPFASRAPATPAAAAPQGPSSRLPDDFDPFAPPVPAPVPQSTAAEPASIFDDLLPRGASPSIDELFGLRSGDGRDLLADFAAETPAHAREGDEQTRAMSTDPLVLFGAPPPPPPVAQLRPDRAPDLHAAFVPPVAKAAPPRRAPAPSPAPVQRPAPAAAAAVPAAPAASAAWSAFCDGAGLKLEPLPGGDLEALRAAGVLLREAIEGTLQLLSLRATTRNEMHADMTMIRAHDNNPLKFSPDGQSALEQLLRPAMRGFLAGPAAVVDAMNDLVAHNIGTMTGTRAALDGVLARFAPQQLETRLEGKTMLDALLPMNRKAKLWELYREHYDGIRDEAHDNFHELFGKAFLDAYEQQVERLRQERSRAAKPVAPGLAG